MQKACKRLGVQLPKLKQSHVQKLQSHDWPGNVRELQNVIERAIITSRSGVLRFDLPQMAGRDRQDTGISAGRRKGQQILKDEQVKRLERENILAALEQTRWKISGTGSTAELLGLSPSTLRSRLKAMGIYPDRPRRRM